MKLKTVCLLKRIFFLLLICSKAYTQTNNGLFKDLNTEQIAVEERQSFTNRNGIPSAQKMSIASTNFDVNYYRCEWRLDPSVKFIKGKVTSYFTITSSTSNIVYDLSDTLIVDSITYKGSQISFQRLSSDGLQLQFPITLNAGQKDSVSIFYNGVPRDFPSYRPFVQTTTPVIYGGNPIVYSLSEPFGAKEWWPCKNGLNDKADSIDILITNPAAYQASSNGVMIQETVDNGNKTSTWKHRYPIASYLVAFAVTKFAVLKDTVMIGSKPMDLVDYAYPEQIVLDYFAQQHPFTKYTLRLYSKLFGDYPFAKEKYGFTNFEANGGMEHQTNSFVVGPSTALIAHETAHQWFGDKITCAGWQHIWLNEGFASYSQVLYNQYIDTANYMPLLKKFNDNIISLPDGSVWVDDTTSADRIFSSRLSYAKGCYLLHMLRWKLGDSVFFNAIKRYLNDPLLKYNFAKTEDLQRNLEQESGQSLSSFFQKWFYGQGYPIYSIEWAQDSSNNAFVKINQSTSHPSVSFYDMPVPIQFKNSTKDTIIVFDHKQNGQTFLVNPGFRADTTIVDPFLWLISRSNTAQVSCSGDKGNNNILPYYNIQWFQNSNNWVNISISQENTAASLNAENIPLYLHFSSDNKDTSIEVKNVRYTYNTWLNTGFKATNVFVSTSCIMNKNYTLQQQNDNAGINDIKIFPVPATGDNINIALKNPSDKQLNLQLYSAAGQLLYQKKVFTQGMDELITIPGSNLPRGVYFIKLRSELAVNLTRKIIKQ